MLKARNGDPVGRSEMYTSKNGQDNGIRSIEMNGPLVWVDDLA